MKAQNLSSPCLRVALERVSVFFSPIPLFGRFQHLIWDYGIAVNVYFSEIIELY